MHYSVKFSGTQGEGVDTAGELMAAALHGQGYWTYGYRNFSSRIKGGYASFEVAFGIKPLRVKKEKQDVYVFIGPDGWETDARDIQPGVMALADSSLKTTGVEGVLALPFLQTASSGPGAIFKWVVALGALGAYLGLPQEAFNEPLALIFGRKGTELIAKNRAALDAGYKMAPAPEQRGRFLLLQKSQQKEPSPLLLTRGSEVVAQAALAVGCNFISGYPISPASDVFSYLARSFTSGPGVAIQTEDEISAIDMAIGASYAGATAMVATSGPGLSLMIEGIGLSSATEVPLLVVNAQRVGPSTGMPTKHEQSDINLSLVGGHGDVLPMVFCPSSLEEIGIDLPRAFYCAEKYRRPVIFLTDAAMMTARASVGELCYPHYDLAEMKETRAIPGAAGRMHHRSGNQLGARGLPTEVAAARREAFSERLKMWPEEMEDSFTMLSSGQEMLIVAIGSSRGAVEVAMEELEGRVSAIFPRVLAPLPAKALAQHFAQYEKILVLDGNAQGQLLNLFKSHFACHDRLLSQKRYDGEPFTPSEIIAYVKEVLRHE